MNQPTDHNRQERYAVAIHDAVESDLSLADQEPAFQALIARAAEAAMRLADAEQSSQALNTLAALGIATYRLDQIRDAARLHRQQLISTRELYAVIEADEPEPAVSSAGQAPATNHTAGDVAAVIGPTMLLGLQDAELDGEGGRQRIHDWIKWISEAVAAMPTVLPAPTDQTADAPAAECSAQHRQFDDGRLCIRAAQHHGDHIDERGYHWSDTVAVYPVADGTCRTGTDVRAELRRLADETPDTQTTAERHRPVALATPCAVCGHPYNWHTRHQGACEFAPVWLSRCGCTGFVPGARPEPVDPRHILGIEADDEPAAGARQDETTATEPELVSGVAQCGHDDYHDPYEWHEQPHLWCPGHTAEPAAARQDGAES